jgi:hypothetical protein
LGHFPEVWIHCVAKARAIGKQLPCRSVFFLAGRTKKPRRKTGNQGVRPGGAGKHTGDEAMKDAFVAAAMVLFAVVMSFFPSAWEPVSEAEARDLLEKEKL